MFVEGSVSKLSKLIRINSTDALSGSVSKSDFYVDLGNSDAVDKCHSLSVKSVIFCNCFYNVNPGNNIFRFDDNAVSRDAVVKIGQYYIADYIVALKTAIDAVLGAGTVAITQDTENFKLNFVFTGTAGDVILYPKFDTDGVTVLNPAGNLTGITATLTANAGNTYTVDAQSTPRMYGLQEAFLQISNVGSANLIDPSASLRNVVVNIPITSAFSEVNVYEPTNDEIVHYKFPTRRSFSRVQVQLIDRAGNVLDLQNHNLRFVLKTWYSSY